MDFANTSSMICSLIWELKFCNVIVSSYADVTCGISHSGKRNKETEGRGTNAHETARGNGGQLHIEAVKKGHLTTDATVVSHMNGISLKFD